MMRMFLTMIRVLLECEKDFLTTLQEFVYSKHKIFEEKTCVHKQIFQDWASDQWRNWIKTAHFTFGWMERLLGSKSQKISLEELGYE